MECDGVRIILSRKDGVMTGVGSSEKARNPDFFFCFGGVCF